MADVQGVEEHTGPEIRLGISFREPTRNELYWYQPAGDQITDRHGRFALGGLAVLVDSAFGGENHWRRRPGTWTVTTELRLDLLGRPAPEATSLDVRTEFLGDDGNCVLTRGEVVDDTGRTVASGLVKSMEIPGPDGVTEVEAEGWNAKLEPGTLEEVLCLTVGEERDGVVELWIAPEKGLCNPLGNLHGGVFAAAAETAGAAVFPHLREVSSASLDVRYPRSVPMEEPVLLRAEAVHSGRSWGVARVSTLDARGRVAAYATVTVYGRLEG